MGRTPTKVQQTAQSRAFIKAARELGADGSEEQFDRALKLIAREPKKPTSKKVKSDR